jgi:hypothetical protein
MEIEEREHCRGIVLIAHLVHSAVAKFDFEKLQFTRPMRIELSSLHGLKGSDERANIEWGFCRLTKLATPNIIIIGVDYYPSLQQIPFLDQEHWIRGRHLKSHAGRKRVSATDAANSKNCSGENEKLSLRSRRPSTALLTDRLRISRVPCTTP